MCRKSNENMKKYLEKFSVHTTKIGAGLLRPLKTHSFFNVSYTCYKSLNESQRDLTYPPNSGQKVFSTASDFPMGSLSVCCGVSGAPKGPFQAHRRPWLERCSHHCDSLLASTCLKAGDLKVIRLFVQILWVAPSHSIPDSIGYFISEEEFLLSICTCNFRDNHDDNNKYLWCNCISKTKNIS